MNKILSVIVPVYNTEKYIQKCLESIFLNLNTDIEVIIVDDGSTDGSLDLIKKLIEKSSIEVGDNIKLLTQVNQGQSVARNNALAISKGEYIAFIDADDYISSTYFEKILPILKDENPDLIKIGAKKFLIDKNHNFQELNFESFSENGLKSINSELLKHLFNDNYWYACLTISKKKLIGKQFPVGIYFEDAVFMSDIYQRATNIFFLPAKIYYYRYHNKSSLNDKRNFNIQKIEKSYEFCLNYFSLKMNDSKIFGISYITFLKSYCIFLLKNRKIFQSFYTHFKHKKNIEKISYKLLTKNSIIYYRKFGFFIILLLFIKGVLN
jgi:glycosyltransferase involved in cell wall biosynthesis